MKSKKYLMSFTTGGLYYVESLLVMELYIELKDWKEVNKQALSSNVLQTRTESTAKRSLKEIISRLETLTPKELDLLINGSVDEQKYILWLSVCKRYEFIKEFAIEVIRERYLTLKHDLPVEEFESFFSQKEQWNEDLEKIADSSRYKMRTVLFKILRESEVIDSKNLFIHIRLTNALIKTISEDQVEYLSIFPISDIDIQRVL